MVTIENIGLIILAAGESLRLGKPKQLLPYKGVTLIEHAAEVAGNSGCKPVICVLGAASEIVADKLKDKHVNIIINTDWQAGMASSIKAGLAKVEQLDPDISGVILMVCDQPYVTPHLLRKLRSTWQRSGKGIVASAYGDTAGTPALFAKDYFSALQHLQGQEGAKKILMAYQSFLTLVPFPLGSIDIDTPEDYHKLEESQ